MHATLVVLLPAFAALFWWQVQRVRQGNTLSWAYVFEWPFFAGYAVYIWWKLVHDQADGAAPSRRPRAHGASVLVDAEGSRTRVGAPATAGRPDDGDDEEEDEELAAYNRYLAELNASGKRKRW